MPKKIKDLKEVIEYLRRYIRAAEVKKLSVEIDIPEEYRQPLLEFYDMVRTFRKGTHDSRGITKGQRKRLLEKGKFSINSARIILEKWKEEQRERI